MQEVFLILKKAVEYISERITVKPNIAIVLGSGLGALAKKIDIDTEINYSEIEGFPVSTVSGHSGKFIFGRLGGVDVVCMQGRVHFYEGYSMEQVVMPIRVMGMLGAKAVILTNAAGGIADGFNAGDLMLITDQIAAFVKNPLIGANIDELGLRFPDMSEVYSERLRDVCQSTANELGINLKKGIYIQLSGPSYETPAEIKMCKILGASAVGMSTACEAIAARHMGMDVLGVSLITNLAAGIQKTKLSHSEVKAAADEAEPKFGTLIEKTVKRIGEMYVR